MKKILFHRWNDVLEISNVSEKECAPTSDDQTNDSSIL